MGQLSFYSADARPHALSDLEGVLCARGQVVMFGRGTTARLSVVLGPPPLGDDAEDEARGDDGAHDHPRDDAHDTDPHDTDPHDTDPHDADPHDAGGPDDGGPDGGPAVDPDDLEFLDLDPEELAAVLAPRAPAVAAGPGPRVASPVPPAVVVAPPALAPRDPLAERRARALCCAFRTRGVEAELDRAPDGRPVVRTAFRADLVELGRRWTRGSVKSVPGEVELDGPQLRLWVMTAGRRAGRAYLLGLDPHAEHTHEPLLAASRRAGLGATLGASRHDPCLRVAGRRRQRRLAELVGDPPTDLAGEVWPD